mmetsp:Transcript_15789/g.43676  ORF Transcript_15789/g.43676 Transcript_15789/m.43676 type:complete len:287 (-) Transcript_15789:588-1448(-)
MIATVAGSLFNRYQETNLQLASLDAFVSPLHPRDEGFEVFLLDGGSAPDSDGRRGITVSTNVVGDILGLQYGNKFLDFVGSQVQCEADGSARASGGILGQEVNPVVFFNKFLHDGKVGLGLGNQSRKSADGIGPFQGVDVILNSQHGRRVDGGSLEDSAINLSLFDHAENLWKRSPFGCVRFQSLNGLGTEDEHTVGSFSSQNLLPRVGGDIKLFPRHIHGEASRSGIAHGDTGTVVRDEVAAGGNTNSRGSTVEGEADVVVRVGLGHIGERSVIGSVFVDFNAVS